jgi:hypothetical protein
MNEEDFEKDFEYYKEDKEDKEDFFLILFITEKILLEKIRENNYDFDDSVSFISLFDNKDRGVCYYNEKEKYNYNYIINLSKKFNINYFTQEVFFDSNEYIDNIYKSYKMNWENIYSQYKKDFKRQTILIDKSFIFSRKIFEDFSNKFVNNKYNSDLTYNKLFIMLTTQSSYYFMYLYSKIFENKFRKLYNNNELYIVNGNSKTIHFELKKEKEINFCTVLTLFLKDIHNDKKIINVIYLEINIIFNLYCSKKNKNCGILYVMII